MLFTCPLRGEEFAPYAVQSVVNRDVAHRNECAHRNSPVDLNLLVNEGNINLRTAKVIPIAAVIEAPAFTHRLAGGCRRWALYRRCTLPRSNHRRRPTPNVAFTLPAAIADIAYQNKAVIYDLLFRTSPETLRPRPTLSAVPAAGSITRGTSPLDEAGGYVGNRGSLPPPDMDLLLYRVSVRYGSRSRWGLAPWSSRSRFPAINACVRKRCSGVGLRDPCIFATLLFAAISLAPPCSLLRENSFQLLYVQ